ncbi:advillin isoform X2 [Coccinella septempunctata]|uniref:advillin isoform X2 n=1 Tax=Coccinella septempunctata TaxID=41139 RepID=UPI001D07E2B5|nr:advillin isoform X2 [Coccinella septempunctata]
MRSSNHRNVFLDDLCINGSNNSSTEAAFRKIQKQWTAFLIWRVEDMTLTALPKEQYGVFNSEEAYVIFSAAQIGQPAGVETVPREVKNEKLEYHVHFWLGADTTPNKSGVAAFKTVELDSILNGVVTQHRESQDYESARFKSYFKNGIRILKYQSNDTTISFPRLFRVRGKTCPVLTEMGGISWSLFNSSYILILQTNKYVFFWVGRSSNASERVRALEIAKELNSSVAGSELVIINDGYEKTLADDHKKEFNKVMPLDKRVILPDTSHQENLANTSYIRLYKCSDNDGKYRVTEIRDGPLKQEDLDLESVFIVDQGTNGIWIWVGSKAPEKEKTVALRNARGFVKKKKYPSYTKVTRVVADYEPYEFKMLFPYWNDNTKTKTKAKPTILIHKFDAQAMEDRPALAAETQLIDNGSGRVTVWRIDSPRATEITYDRHGYFFSGDCYIVLYTYNTKKENHLLYYWLGTHATQEDLDCTIRKLSEIEAELERIGLQARIIQGYEPAHFLQIFRGKMTIFQGKGSMFDANGKNTKLPSQYLIKVYGTTKYESKAEQVPMKCSYLNSNYCFVLVRGKNSYIWCGQYSNGDHREMAKAFVKKEFEIVLEGKEKQEFFDLLGGKSNYDTTLMKNEFEPKQVRLFCYSNINGTFLMEEIHQFAQKNLIPEDIMLLDANEALYIWIGNLSSKEDQKLSLKLAIDYLQMDPSGRDMNIPIMHVRQSEEPPTFTGFFPTWNKKFWKHYKTFSRQIRDIESSHNGHDQHINNGIGHSKVEGEFDQYDKYPLEVLLAPNENLPARVDPLKKELHLTHDDFLSVFEMNYKEFQELPKWKQQEIKKKVKLF